MEAARMVHDIGLYHPAQLEYHNLQLSKGYAQKQGVSQLLLWTR